MQKVTTYLTFKEKGEEAVKFYVSLFKNSKINSIVLSDGIPGMPKGALLNASFTLDGQEYMAMDGGESFSFAQGTSLLITTTTQEETDHFYDKLAEGGEEQPCAWVKDKYGLSWQVVPTILSEYIQDPDREKANRVMQAMLKMKKIIIKDLQDAYDDK